MTTNDSNGFNGTLANVLEALAATAQQLAGQVLANGDRSHPSQMARLLIAADKAAASLRKFGAHLGKPAQ